MFDVALHAGVRAAGRAGIGAQLGLAARGDVLATIHRAETTDDLPRLASVVEGLGAVAERIPVVWPLHPRTRAVLEREGWLSRLPAALHVVEPVDYLDMVQLEQDAAVIATDSGGVQKEAFFHRLPCVTLRDETEWTELVDAGWNRLAPPRSGALVRDAVLAAIGTRGVDIDPYGSGDAAVRIVARLRADLGA